MKSSGPLEPLPLFPPQSLTISSLTRYLRELLESDEVLRDVWVQGEISNFTRASSGHVYLTLKDAGAALRCVIWRTTAAKIQVALQNGMAVEAHRNAGGYERDRAYPVYIDAGRGGQRPRTRRPRRAGRPRRVVQRRGAPRRSGLPLPGVSASQSPPGSRGPVR